jgi:hypothetical protein
MERERKERKRKTNEEFEGIAAYGVNNMKRSNNDEMAG